MHKISAVVLAAGLSQRMGDKNKLLMPIDGEPMLRHTVAMLGKCHLQEVIVVLGHEHEAVQLSLTSLNIESVVNPEYQQGQMTSVHCGLHALTKACDGVLIMLSDQPGLTMSNMIDFIAAFSEKGDNDIVVPSYQGRRGNPVIISSAVRTHLLDNEGSLTCRQYIDMHPESIKWVDTNNAAFVTDLDTPEEYRDYCNASTFSKQ